MSPSAVAVGEGVGRYFGRPVRRLGNAQLPRGGASYVDDVKPAGCLHVALLRSPFAHAWIRGVDVAAAAAAPGVVDVVSGTDVEADSFPIRTRLAPGAHSPDRHLLAHGRARFAGEAVVAVVAQSRYQAEDAVELVEVDWAEVPAVIDVDSALAADAPQVHDDVPGNLYAYRELSCGDVDAALARADLLVETEVVHPRVVASPIECRGVVAIPTPDRLMVYASTQHAHGVKETIVDCLGLAPAQVQVIVPDVGGGFGVKAHVYPEDVRIPWLAVRTRRPVRWIEDRAEHLLCANHSRDQRVRLVAGFTREGRLTAVRALVVSDVGAYGVHPMGTTLDLMTCSGLIPGPYDLRAYRFESRAVATNKAPGGAFRGVGMTTAVLAHECLLDTAARRLVLDPAEVRRRNLVAAASMPYTTVTGHPYESADFGAALEAALESFGYDSARREQRAARTLGRLLGIGIASYVEVTAGGSNTFNGRGMVDVRAMDSARTWLDAEGVVHVQSSSPDIGQGTATTFAQVVAEALGVDLEVVQVEQTDTSKVSTGFGTGMSRSAATAATSAHRAAGALKAAILEAGAWHLDVPTHDLLVEGREVRSISTPAIRVGLDVLGAAGAAGNGGVELDTESVYDAVRTTHPYGTHVCMVEVEPETGHVRVVRYVVVEDCGRLINPLIVEGQVHGSVTAGLGGALLEEIRYAADGQPVTASFMDYLLPTAAESPELEVHHLEFPSAVQELGTKGTGESGTVAAPAAIANAVADALQVEVSRLPLSPDRIHELLARRAARVEAPA